MKISLKLIISLGLILIQCASRQQSESNISSGSIASDSQSTAASMPEYQLGFGDVIEVKFFKNNQFNEQLIVRPDGRISMERVGDIVVAGLTPQQLSTMITEAYSRFIKNPEVTVIVREFGGNQIYVLGEVNKPGAYPLQQKLSILQSIAIAGGQKDTAKLRSVILMRRSRNGSIDARRINLSGLSPEIIQKNDEIVEAFDIIYIPKTFIANVNTFLDQAFSGVLQPLDIYLRAVWWIGLQ